MSETNTQKMSAGDIFSQFQLKKDFLKRPEGKIGLSIGILVLLGIFAPAIKVTLDATADIAWDLVSIAIATGSLVVGGLLIWSTWPIVWKFWQTVCRNMHRWLVHQAPLAYMYAFREDRFTAIQSLNTTHQSFNSTRNKIAGQRDEVRKKARKVEVRLNALGTDQAMQDDDFDTLNQQALAYAEHLKELDARIADLDSIIKRLEERIRSRKKKLSTYDVKIQIAESKAEVSGDMREVRELLKREVAESDDMSDGMLALKYVDEDFDTEHGAYDALDFELEDLTREDRLDALVANAEGLSRLKQALSDSEQASAAQESASRPLRVVTTSTRSPVRVATAAEEPEASDPYASAFGSESKIPTNTHKTTH